MSRAMQTVRQWVPALGGACEVRIGHGTIADCEALAGCVLWEEGLL